MSGHIPDKMPYEEKLLRRYLAVHALAERGSTDGERFAAATRRGEMEEKYPGIGIDALRLQAQEAQKGQGYQTPPPQPPPPPPPPPKPPPQDPNFGPYTAAGGNWGTAGQKPQPDQAKNRWAGFGDFLGEAWNIAKDVTQTVVNAEAGRQWAERMVRIEGSQTAAGNYRLTAVTTVAELLQARASLNDAQKQAFAKAIGDMVAAQVYTLISPDLGSRTDT